jgi:probable F420-dependent oxidoreductase
MASAAEDAGFDSVWVGDSLYRSARFEPLALLGAVAARTSRVTIGTAILVAPLRHPLALAHATATIDRIAAGRLVLGLGAGWIQEEFDALGVPFDQRVGRLAETVRLLRALWSGEKVSASGRYWSFEDVEMLPTPTRPEGPSIWVGGNGPSAQRLAGRLGDGWLPTPASRETFAEGWKTVAETADASGRAKRPTPAAYVTLNLDPDKGPEELRSYAQAYYGLPYEVMSQLQGYFAGDCARCSQWLQGFVDAGVRHLIVRFGSFDAAKQLERAAAEVLPALG